MMTTNTIADYSRVRVRPMAIGDLGFVLKAERDPENAPFIREWSEAQHRSAIQDDTVAHWIVEARSDGRPVGYLILFGIGDEDRGLLLKRIVIAEKGEGFGRDTMRLLKKIAFKQLGVHRLWLDVVVHNTRAQRLYETEGFVVEGTLREAAEIQGRFESLLVMSMLESEYKPSEPSDGHRVARSS